MLLHRADGAGDLWVAHGGDRLTEFSSTGQVLQEITGLNNPSAVALGGPAPGTRSVLGLGTGQRNVAAALVIATQNFTDPGVVRLHLVRDGRDEQATARMVVDASGRRTLLGTQLRWRIKDPVFDQYALHTWFQGYDRLAFTKDQSFRDHLFVHFLSVI